MLKKCQKITCFIDEKHEADDFTSLPSHLLPSPCIHSKLPRVCRHHVHMLKTHVRVVPAYTGVFSVSHTTHHNPPHHNPPQQHDHHTTQRQTERETLREEETKEKREERREKIHFQCGGAWPFLVGVVLCLVKPVNARVFSLLNSVKYDSSLISMPFGQFRVFELLRINFSLQSQFFFEFFCLCSYSFKIFRII